MTRHSYVPTFSYGNVISTIGIIGGGIVVWVSLNINLARAEEGLKATQAQVAEVKQDTNARVERIERKLEDLAEQQAATNANLAMLLRAQGLRPVEVRND